MEIPEISIKQINVPEIYIPEIYKPDPVLPVITNLEIDVVGCTYQHRDIKNTGNTQLLLDDPNGVFTTCDGGAGIPSFYPMDWNPKDIKVIEEKETAKEEPQPISETKATTPEIPEKKNEEVFKPCPGVNDQRVGDYRNEKKLERVSGHEVGLSGECITLYEPVAFIEQYLPTPATAVSTGAIALIAASSPLILNIIKPAVKNIFKKLTSKKKKQE